MKKVTILASLMLLAALVLSACGGANNNTAGNNDALLTPEGGDLVETPVTGDDLEPSPTLAVTDVMEATPTVAVEEEDTATPAVEEEVTATPQAEVPVTGDDEMECVPNRLTSILDYEVMDDAGNVIGDVDAVIVLRDASVGQTSISDDADAAAQATATPAGGAAAGQATATPAGDDVDGAVTLDAANLAAPTIAYVIVDMDDAGDIGDKDVLVPFGALTLPAVADEDVADCDFTVAGDASVLAGAPNLDDNEWENLDFDVDTWNDEFNTYWQGQGVTVVETDATTGAQLGSPVIFREEFDDIDVQNTEGEDLGEIEDFVFDQETGQLQYAIFAAGGFLGLGERYIPVPMNQILWGNLDDDTNDLGEMILDIDAEAFENAPFIENLDELDTTVDTWDEEFNTFWEGLEVQ